MNRKLKVSIVFFLGFFVGFLIFAVLISIGLYRFYKVTGMPYAVLGPSNFGNIKITAADNVEKMNKTNEVMGVDGVLSLQKEGKNIVGLLFDKDKRVMSISLYNDQEDSIVDIDISKTTGKMRHLTYGSLENELDWYDLNCDGVFDLQLKEYGKVTEIMIDNEWATVTERIGFDEVIVGDKPTETKYSFDYNKGKWLPVCDEYKESPSAGE